MEPTMEPMVEKLSREDMLDLAEYFAARKPKPVAFKADAARVARGRKKAEEVLCTMCHLGGMSGQNEIPRVAGQHPEYVIKQLKAFKARTRTNDAGSMTSVARTITEQAMEELAHYISSIDQKSDVLLGDGPGDAGHAARVVGARARLESLELLDDVFWVLARDPRDLVLSGHSSQVAHGAQDLFGLFPAAGDARGVRLERDGLGLAGGEVFGEIEHVLARKLLHHRLHRRLHDRRRKPRPCACPRQDPRAPPAERRRAIPGREFVSSRAPQKTKGRPRAASKGRRDQGRANTTTLLPRLKSIWVLPPAATATYCLPFTV